MSSILIVDDHPLIGQCISMILSGNGHNILGTVTSGQAALEKALHLKPDVIIMDIHLPDLSGLEVIEAIRATQILSRIVVLTTYSDGLYMRRCWELGVSAYILKSEMTRSLIDIIEQVIAGKPSLPNQVGFTKACELPPALCESEKAVLSRLGSGQSDGDISREMGISQDMVNQHRARAQKKLRAKSPLEAIVTACKLGLITAR